MNLAGSSASPGGTAYVWLMLLALVSSLLFWVRVARRDDQLLFIYLSAVMGAFFGAKVIYLLCEGWQDWGAPDQWARWRTGKSILGALLGGYVGVEFAKSRIGYTEVTGDRFAEIVPLSLVVGRLGCWRHGCCLGAVCDASAWWTLKDTAGVPRWPAVPVEIAFNLAAAVLFWVWRRQGRWPGQHFHIYLMAYGVFRFVHECARATPRIWGWLSGYQLAALAVAALGAWGFWERARRALQRFPAASPELLR